MDSEAEIIIAFLFNRSGKTTLTEAELYLPLSMELGWLSTKEAQEFVKYALKQGLLVRKNEGVAPSFPLEKTTIPLGFIPSKNLFLQKAGTEEKEDVMKKITAGICSQTHQNLNDIQDEITKEQKEKHLLPEVAALYVARRYHVDITDWFLDVEQHVFQRK